jgi:hypothetical protein
MRSPVTFCTERYEIFFGIISKGTATANVMDLQIG